MASMRSADLARTSAPPSDAHRSSCPVCHGLTSLPWAKAHLGFEAARRLTTTVSAWQTVAERKDCSLCAAAWEGFRKFPPAQGWPPTKHEVTVFFRGPSWNVLELGLSMQGTTEPEEHGEDHILQKSEGPQEHLIYLFKGRQLPDSAVYEEGTPAWRNVAASAGNEQSLEAMLGFLAVCMRDHNKCVVRPDLEHLPTRLVGIFGDRIMVRPTRIHFLTLGIEVFRYATLSYCWGAGPTGPILTHASFKDLAEGLLIEDLPPTLRDAILVAKHLGIHLIWIDRLCIFQDDRNDWQRQSTRMCDVYQNSQLCINAGRAKDVWSGLFGAQTAADLSEELISFTCDGMAWEIGPSRGHPTFTMLSSEVSAHTSARAWTLQEQHMSKRILHFLPSEVVWECDEITVCECRRIWRAKERLLQALGTDDRQAMLWAITVEAFSKRALTYENDKLPALAGLSKQFSLHYGSSEFVAGLWKSDLPRQLCWRAAPQKRESLKEKPLASDLYLGPSWSWLSTSSSVRYFQSPDPQPFSSALDILDVKVHLLDADHEFGQITAASLQVRGYTVDVQLSPIDAVEEQGYINTTHVLSDNAGNCCSVDLDNPLDTNGAANRFKCILVGAVVVPAEGSFTVKNTDDFDDIAARSARSKVGSPAFKRHEAGLDQMHPSWWANHKKNNPGIASRSGPRQYPEGFDAVKFDSWFEDSNPRGQVVIMPYTFYLILAASTKQRDAYERIGCFLAGFSIDKKEVMQDMFGRSIHETLIII